MTFLNKLKQGFTLAEILVTLGIIGVIAALTIPGLMNHIRDTKFSALMREDYAILAQLMLRVNDTGAMASLTTVNDMDEMKNAFNTYFLPNIKTISVCYDKPGCWSEDKTKYLNGQDVKWFFNGKPGEQVICFTIANGSYVCLDDYPDYELWSFFGIKNTGARELAIFVDINGNSKPNVFGRDVFTFIVLGDGSLVPAGRDKTVKEQKEDCSTSGTGAFCTAYLKSQNWDFTRIKYVSDY